MCACVCSACFTSIGHSALWVCVEILSELLPFLLCDIQPEEGESLRDRHRNKTPRCFSQAQLQHHSRRRALALWWVELFYCYLPSKQMHFCYPSYLLFFCPIFWDETNCSFESRGDVTHPNLQNYYAENTPTSCLL